MARAVVYVLLSWLATLVVTGMASALHLTVMLPSISAIVIAHAAFLRSHPLVLGLTVAMVIGHLEDLQQGAPAGVLALAHGIDFLVLRWMSIRVDLRGVLMRSIVALFSVVVIDLATWGVLMAVARSMAIHREALTWALLDVRWHALATMLVAPPTWLLIDRVHVVFHLQERELGHMRWIR